MLLRDLVAKNIFRPKCVLGHSEQESLKLPLGYFVSKMNYPQQCINVCIFYQIYWKTVRLFCFGNVP